MPQKLKSGKKKNSEWNNFDLDSYIQMINQVRRQNKDIFKHVRTHHLRISSKQGWKPDKVDVRTQATVEMIQEWNEKSPRMAAVQQD